LLSPGTSLPSPPLLLRGGRTVNSGDAVPVFLAESVRAPLAPVLPPPTVRPRAFGGISGRPHRKNSPSPGRPIGPTNPGRPCARVSPAPPRPSHDRGGGAAGEFRNSQEEVFGHDDCRGNDEETIAFNAGAAAASASAAPAALGSSLPPSPLSEALRRPLVGSSVPSPPPRSPSASAAGPGASAWRGVRGGWSGEGKRLC